MPSRARSVFERSCRAAQCFLYKKSMDIHEMDSCRHESSPRQELEEGRKCCGGCDDLKFRLLAR